MPPANATVGIDCFVEPVIGRRYAPTRWLAMTVVRDNSIGLRIHSDGVRNILHAIAFQQLRKP